MDHNPETDGQRSGSLRFWAPRRVISITRRKNPLWEALWWGTRPR